MQDVTLALYIAICTVEYVVLLCLMFALFRRDLDMAELARMVLVGLSLECVDFVLKQGGNDAGTYSVLIQLALIISFLTFLFRVQLFYSAIMGIIGFAAYALIQIALIHLLTALHLYWVDGSKSILNLPTVILQAVSMAFALLLAAFLKRGNHGFSFVPHDPHIRFEWSRINIRVLAVLIIAIISLGFTWYAYWIVDMYWFGIGSIILFVVFFVALAVALRKEREL